MRHSKMKKMKGHGRADRIASRRKKIKAWISKANNFLKKTKLISKLGSAYGKSNLPYADIVKQGASVASQLGYGRRRSHRKMKGGALRLAGGGLRLAGGMRRKRY